MTESEENNPDPALLESRPRVLPCHANNYFQTLKDIRAQGGHIEQIKVGPGNGEYTLVVGWG